MVKLKRIEMPKDAKLEKSSTRKIIGGTKYSPSWYDPSTDTYGPVQVPEVSILP